VSGCEQFVSDGRLEQNESFGTRRIEKTNTDYDAILPEIPVL